MIDWIVRKLKNKNKRPKPSAIVIGSSGQLGPIWKSELDDMGYDTVCVDKPEIDAGNSYSIYRWASKNKALLPSVVVYNAAIDTSPGSVASFFTDYGRIIDVNLKGSIAFSRLFVQRAVRAARRLTIVYIGSIQGFVGADWRNYPPGFEKPVGYNVSKAGLMQLARSVTVQYGKYGVRAVVIAFGAVDTPKLKQPFKDKYIMNVPTRRFVSEASLRATLRFAVDCRDFAGQTVLVDGGYTSW